MYEAFGAGAVGGQEDLVAALLDEGGVAQVHRQGRQQANAAVSVLGVVPVEERPAEGPRGRPNPVM